MATMLYSDEPDFQLSDSLSVLRRDIPWDIYQTARLITDRDLQLLRRFDKKEPAYQGKLLEEVGAGEGRAARAVSDWVMVRAWPAGRHS